MPRVSIPCDDSPLHVTIKDHPAVLVVEENDVHGYPLEHLDDGAMRAAEVCIIMKTLLCCHTHFS